FLLHYRCACSGCWWRVLSVEGLRVIEQTMLKPLLKGLKLSAFVKCSKCISHKEAQKLKMFSIEFCSALCLFVAHFLFYRGAVERGLLSCLSSSRTAASSWESRSVKVSPMGRVTST